MADVNDPSSIGPRLRNEWDRLEDAAIEDADRDAIEAFVEWRRDIDNVARNTRINDLKHLRLAATRSETPLLEMSRTDVERLLSLLQRPRDRGGYGLDPDSASMYSYTRALRIFFRYLDARDPWPAFPFHEAIEITDVEMQGSSDREAMLTGDEIEALKDAANHPRDRALIAILGDIGGRITMILSLRVGDVHPDGDEPYIEPNTDVVDGLKDLAVDRIPLLHSRGEIRSWLNRHHPDRETPEAPLWPKIRGYDPEQPQASATSSSRIRDVLRQCGERAGLEKDIEPHVFRRTAATRLSNAERLNPQEIAQITGWSETTVHEMLDIYDYTTDAERNSAIHAALGFSDGPDGETGSDLELDSVVCGTCDEQYSGARFCPRCGAPRDEEARALKRELDETAGDRVVDADSTEEAATVEALRSWARDNPDRAVDALMDGVGLGDSDTHD
jgi:integrase